MEEDAVLSQEEPYFYSLLPRKEYCSSNGRKTNDRLKSP